MSDLESKGTARRLSGRSASLAGLSALNVAAACSTGSGSGTLGTSGAVGSTSSPAPSAASGYVTLTRGAHPLARPEYDVGRLDPTRVLHNLSLVFKLSPGQRADRDALLAEIERPGSPVYRQWLTPEEYAVRFGAQSDDIARASSWLTSQGMTVHEPSRLGARVTFTGTVAQIEAAFQTEMHLYSVHGETHYAMARPPSVPADLGDRVLAVYNAHDFYPRHSKPQIKVVGPDALCPAGALNCTAGVDGIAPPDWATIYDVSPLYNPGIGGTLITGTGVTIAIVGVAEISQTDLTAFRTRYGFAANPITMTLVPNTGAAQAANGAGIEAVLDTEWSGAIAQNATIHYVYVGAGDLNVSDAAYYAIEQSYGGVLSESFGGCEEGTTTADADVLEVYGSAANLEGITYLASSGDSGAAGCQGEGGLWVNMPASYPGVTGVGGTGFAIGSGLTFNGAGAVTARGTEAVWNEFHNAYTANGVAAGGGGISSVFARPSYQSAIATCTPVGTLPSGVTAANQRQVPDVAFTAAEGASQYGNFIECTFDNAADDCNAAGTDPVVIEIGGTSASTPSFAGVVALANQATGGRLGNINPLLYAFNVSQPTFFHDIITGTNEVECRTADTGCPGNNVLYGYAATAGYDCASGLGSIDAAKLVTSWSPTTTTPTATSLTAAPTATTEGANVTLNATVAVDGTNANALGGTVTFTFQSYLANGIDFDQSWTLGQVTIAGGTTTGGTASLTTPIPPGMVRPNQIVDVYAMYGGDANHLPSYSAKQQVTFTGVAFCIDPPTDSVAAGGKIAFTALGGVTPVRWYIDWDSTCNAAGANCSTLNETTGAFVAGTGAKGYVIVEAFDADGVDTYAEVTVGGGGGIIPWSNGPSNYSEILVSATAATTCPTGDNCSTVPNGCGGTVSCGTCTAPQTCGGGTPSNPNQCGCTPTATTCPAGDNCGTVPNGCGGTVSCGAACTAPQTCGGGGTANVCGCTPITTCPAGDNCGTVSNGCGGTVTCGAACTAPQTCGGGGTANVCGCTPATTCPAGDNCGTVSNGCGGTVSCGTCGSSETCTANKCVGVDAGTDAGSGEKDSGTGSTDSGGGATDSGSGGTDSGSGATDSGGGGTDSGNIGEDAGAGEDSGVADEDSGTASEDSGTVGGEDSGTVGTDSGTIGIVGGGEDASPPVTGEDGGNGAAGGGVGASAGCGCVTAGSRNDDTHVGAIGALLFGLATFGRRRRGRR